MGSTFDDIAALAAPVLVEHFGERDGDGELIHHVITLPTGVLILWPASVGELKQEELFDRGKVEVRELCILHGAAADMPTGGYYPFPKQTTVLVEKYGEPRFNVYPLQSAYGGQVITLALVRQALHQLGNNQGRSNSA